MHCKVFRLYDHGIRLEKHAAQQNSPKVGRWVYGPRVRTPEMSDNVFTVQLLATGSDQCILPVLERGLVDLISTPKPNHRTGDVGTLRSLP